MCSVYSQLQGRKWNDLQFKCNMTEKKNGFVFNVSSVCPVLFSFSTKMARDDCTIDLSSNDHTKSVQSLKTTELVWLSLFMRDNGCIFSYTLLYTVQIVKRNTLHFSISNNATRVSFTWLNIQLWSTICHNLNSFHIILFVDRSTGPSCV